MSSVGDNIRNLRESAHITQDDLAEMAGVNRVTIAKYESGKIMPGAITLARLAKALHVSADVLLGNGEDDMTAEEREMWELREQILREPERAKLFRMARYAEIGEVRKANAILDALKKSEEFE